MTEAQRLADELREALTIGREAAYEVAQTYHASMAGYRLYEHDRLDADVKKIDAAIGHLASMIPAGSLAEEANSAQWWIGPEGQRMSPETYAAWAPSEPARAALYRRENSPQGQEKTR